MNIKNNQFWDDAMGEIDEKLIAEAAEAHAKNASKAVVDSAGAVDAGEPIVIPTAKKTPVSRKRMFITMGSIAAALVLCIGIGGVLMNRFSQPIAPVTSGNETIETSETDENGQYDNENTQNQVTIHALDPIDTDFGSAVIFNSEDDDCYMQLSDSAVEQLKTAIGKFKDSEPVTDGSKLKPYAENASLSLYDFEPFEGESRVIKLFTDNDGYKEEYDRYYYGITSPVIAPYYTYYEVYFDDWVALLEMFGEVPMLMELTVVEDNGDGTYVAKHEKGGQTYLIPTNEQYEVGDEIDVCYYGMPLGEEPFTTNVLWTRYSYDINEDTSLIWDGTVRSDVDWNIFERYFAGEWGTDSPEVLSLSYAYDSFTDMIAWEGREFKIMACYELEDGYYLEYDFAVDITEHTNLLYVPKKDSESMYLYTGYNSRTGAEALKNTEDKIEYYLDNDIPTDDYALSLIGELGAVGRQRFGMLMGEDYVEFSKQFDEDFTDNQGNRWTLPTDLPIRHKLSYWLKEYSAAKDKVTIVQNYVRVDDDFNSTDDSVFQYVTAVAEKINGEWQMTDRYLSDYYGNSLSDKLYETVYHVYSVFTEYHIENGAVSDLHIYSSRIDDTDKVISDVEVINPHVKDGKVQLPVHLYDELTIATAEETLNSGDVIIVRVPYEQDNALRYSYTIYNSTPEGELVLIEGAFPDSSHSRWFMNVENNTIAFLADEGVDIYRIDFNTNTMALVDYTAEGIDNFKLDTAISKADPSLEGFGNGGRMYGWWGNSNTRLCINNYSKDIFDYDDPCLGWYTDDNGVYMLGMNSGEYQLWFMPGTSAMNSDSLFRYDNVTEGMNLNLRDYDECYQRLDDESSPFSGIGEQGYIGMMEYCGLRDITVRELELEITDGDGVRWVRDNSDLSLDWGYLIETNVNGMRSVQMKFLNPQTGELRWVTLPYDFDWRGYYYTGDVYFLEPSINSTPSLSTEYSDYVMTQVAQSRYGNFVVDENYYTCPDGTYYLVSHMGNIQAQWLGNSEVFYYNGNGWQLISDELGLCNAVSVGNHLYVLRNEDDDISSDKLWLNVYTGTELNYELCVGEGHTGYAGLDTVDEYIVVSTGFGCYIYRSDAINAKPLFVDAGQYYLETDDLIIIVDGYEYSLTNILPEYFFE